MDANTTIIISLVTLVLAIFGASWLNQRSTERLFEQMEKRFDARFETLISEIKRLDNRIDSLEKRLESFERQIDQRLESFERQIDQRLDKIERQLEAIFKPVLPK